MRHLDDGRIAEFVDSTVPADPTDRRSGGPGDDVAEHLRTCAVCRERVEEARQIAERAKAILGTAVPVGTTGSVVPPFEEVLHRAGRAKTRRARMGTMRWLAWAATLVIAGGLGWYARDHLGTSTAVPRPAASSLPSVARAEQEPTAAATEPKQVALADRAAPAEEQKSQPTNEGKVGAPAAPPAAQAAGATSVASTSAEAERLEAGARRDQAVGAVAPPAMQNLAAPQARLETRREVAEPEAPAMAKAVAQVVDALDEHGWMPATREAAEQALGGPVVTVEGLPVASYQLRTSGGVLVRTIQSLGSGTALELFQSPVTPSRVAAAAPAPTAAAGGLEMRARAAPGAATDSMVINGFRIVGRAPISLDSLRALLKRIK